MQPVNVDLGPQFQVSVSVVTWRGERKCLQWWQASKTVQWANSQSNKRSPVFYTAFQHTKRQDHPGWSITGLGNKKLQQTKPGLLRPINLTSKGALSFIDSKYCPRMLLVHSWPKNFFTLFGAEPLLCLVVPPWISVVFLRVLWRQLHRGPHIFRGRLRWTIQTPKLWILIEIWSNFEVWPRCSVAADEKEASSMTGSYSWTNDDG